MRLMVIFLGIVVLLAGCAQEQPSQAQQPGAPSQQGQPPPSSPPGMNADTQLNDCIKNICSEDNDSISKICRVSCWDDYAVAKSDPSYCDKNIELINSSTGFAVCVEAVAKSTNDPSPCALIKSEFSRDLCYVELAKWLEDPSVCDNVEDGEVMLTKTDCLNALKD
jgi:hypothetical protein